MKIYNKLGIFAVGTLMMASCAVNDPFADKMEVGEVVPTVSWELASGVCKAGNEAGFLGKYYTTDPGVTVDHSEVWGMIIRTESAAATVKLVTSPAYTKTVNLTDTVRGFHLLATFPHSEEYLNGKEYHLNGAFPTSRTLAPVAWVNPTAWDDAKFDMYYPESFKQEFCATMVDYLTSGSTYLASLRSVYMNYAYTQDQFDAVNAQFAPEMALPFSDSDVEGETRGDLWFNTDVNTVIGYYYTVLDEAGVAQEIEVATVEEAVNAGIPAEQVFEVYKAPKWLFSRYSDNTGGVVTTMRPEYAPMWKALVELIKFEEWIYNGGDTNYAVEFNRKYAIEAQFRVIDSKNGVGRDTDVKTVELN